MVSAYPMSSGRLGPPSRTPSWRRRRKEASPPGPDSRSTAFPMVVLLHTAVMSTSTPRRTGGRTLIDLDPGQLKWILLARESTLRERQLDHQLTDLRARVASIGGHDRPGDTRERRLGVQAAARPAAGRHVRLPGGAAGVGEDPDRAAPW